MREPGFIVAGFDGSAEAAAAVRWAARQARLRGRRLQVVHVSLWPLLARHLGPVPGVADSGLERAAESTLEEGVAIAEEAAPELHIEPVLLHGLPGSHLVAASAGQEMLVVGSRGLGGFLGLLVGSVSLEAAATAACPVAVLRSDLVPRGPVVAAVDGAGSPRALEDACAMALAEQAPLTVVHVEHSPAGYGQQGMPGGDPAARHVVDAAVEHARNLAPYLPVEGKVLVDSSTAHAILMAADHARMLVVGSKGHGLLRETIGSTAHAVLHHARGPVLISRHGNGE